MTKTILGMMLSFALCACGGTTSNSEVVTMNSQLINGVKSGQSGSATLTDNGNSTTTVVIAVSGGADTGSQPAHIHTGQCGSNGPIYAALNNVQNGQNTSTVAFSLSALQGNKYYINVHNSTDPTNIQVCGNIQ